MEAGDDGAAGGRSEGIVLRVRSGCDGTERPSAPPDRSLRERGPTRSARRVGTLLQRDRPALDRPRADDPDADRGLLLRHPLGAAALRRGRDASGLSLVLPARSGGAHSAPFDLLGEPARPVPGERRTAPCLRARGPGRDDARLGQGRGLRRRCQRDRGGREPLSRCGAGRDRLD